MIFSKTYLHQFLLIYFSIFFCKNAYILEAHTQCCFYSNPLNYFQSSDSLFIQPSLILSHMYKSCHINLLILNLDEISTPQHNLCASGFFRDMTMDSKLKIGASKIATSLEKSDWKNYMDSFYNFFVG